MLEILVAVVKVKKFQKLQRFGQIIITNCSKIFFYAKKIFFSIPSLSSPNFDPRGTLQPFLTTNHLYCSEPTMIAF